MSAMQGALSAAERSMRSVFVGNIPYEATEEQLKDIFAEVGPVVSFRLVYDRETGKPKGYGFCEYKDQEMALSAMRNLNGYELNGRALRVDNAASEKSKEELKNLQASLGGPPVESPFGPEISPDQAPDAIAKVMSSLPPEQLYELMMQMKVCIENNPNESRILLMQNPQLSYALLQAQVIMKIVDPIQAKAMLHSQNPFSMSASALLPTPDAKPSAAQPQSVLPGINDGPPFSTGPSPIAANPAPAPPQRLPHNAAAARPSLLGDRPVPQTNPMTSNQYPDRGMDSRALGDHDLRQMPMSDRDMRAPPMLAGDKDMRHQATDEDFRAIGGPNRMPVTRPLDSRFENTQPGMQNIPHGDVRNLPPPDMRNMRNMPPGEIRNMPPGDMRNMPASDMRNMPPGDMRNMSSGDMRNMPPGDMRNMSSGDVHRMGQNQGRNMSPADSHNMPPSRNMGPMDSRNLSSSGPRNMPPMDGRGMPGPDSVSRAAPLFDRTPSGGNFEGHRPPGANRMEDHRNPAAPMNTGGGPRPQNPRIGAVGSPAIGGQSPNPAPSPRSQNALAAAAAAIAPHDQEKASLIMQVLQLSEQQIAMLPPEQRQSILILKEQIARSTQAS